MDDVDLWEINEAFAPVPIVVGQELGIPLDRIDVQGGAIALGHPLGATGAMLLGDAPRGAGATLAPPGSSHPVHRLRDGNHHAGGAGGRRAPGGEPERTRADTSWPQVAWHATHGGTSLEDVDLRPATAPEVFRPRPVLAAAMGIAALLWLFVLVYLMQFEGVPAKTFISAIFFVVFFGVSADLLRADRHRGRRRRSDLSRPGPDRLLRLPGHPEGRHPSRSGDGLRGPGPGAGMHFTSFFTQHRRLMELLVERAGLSRMR